MKKKVYAYLHTHWDMEWYRDKEDFDIRLIEVVDGILDELENKNTPCFYFDGQAMALLNYLKIKPENKNRIIKLIKEKKLFIGPFFVSADTYLVNFVSMIKNLEIGLKYSKEFHQEEFIGYICDVFGISNSIFKALKIKNIKNAVIWRGVNPKKINNNCNFIKNGINTLWLAQGYFNDFLHANPINIEGLKKYLDKISIYSKDTVLLPIGADHLGILKDAKNKIKEINNQLNDYEIILTSPFEYFKNTKFEYQTKEEEFLDNSNTYILSGVYSARIPQKIKNAIIQNKISRIIEPINYFLDEKYSKNISSAYEILLKNHAHDSICGCSLDRVAKNVDFRFLRCENILNSIEKNILQYFKKNNSKEKKSVDSVGLFNLSNFDNIKTVEIKLPYILKNSQVLDFEEKFLDEHLSDIYKIPVTEEIVKIYRQLIEVSDNKKMSFSSVKIIKPKNKVKITKNSIENDFIKLEIRNKRVFVFDKNRNLKTELLLTDIKDKGDSYNSAPTGEYKILNLTDSKILYKGIIQSAIELKYSNIKLKVILNNNSEFLQFSAKINNKTKNHKLQVVLIVQDSIKNTISNDAIGIIERKTDFNYDIRNYMPAKRPVELKTNSYPMQNFVVANNIGVLTKGLNEYEIFKNELKICLLRAFDTISNPKNPARSIPAGPNLKTPDAQLLGENNVEFAIFFGNYKKGYNYIDEFYKNYLTIDGEYKIVKNFIKLEKNDIFCGFSENKKIIYNLNDKKISLI